MLGIGAAGPRGEWRGTEGTRGAVAERVTTGPAAVAGPADPGEPAVRSCDRQGAWAAAVASATPVVAGRGDKPADGLSESDAWAVLASVDGLGPVSFGALLRSCGDARAVLRVAASPGGADRLVAAALAEETRLGPDVALHVVAAAADPEVLLGPIRAAGLDIVTVETSAYPVRLRGLDLPPPVLFVQGERGALSAARSVAVVGTRRATDAGRRIAGEIAAALVRVEAVVVSGLAIGIDGAAHAAAVAAGGRTVAVLGGGHDRLYPRAHERLAAGIVRTGGAIVSELPPGALPTRGTFPRRNRVISGLADATIIVEAGERSGALITAHWALEQGRECFLVPGPIDAPRSVGCNRFLHAYAGAARIVAGIPELLEDLGFAEAAAPGRRRARPDPTAPRAGQPAVLASLGVAETAVATALRAGPRTADGAAAAAGLAVPAALAVLTRLEEAGVVIAAYGRYRLADDLDRATGADRP